jgi:hypothetical protein
MINRRPYQSPFLPTTTDDLAANGQASDENVTPLINQLNAALDKSSDSFNRIPHKHREPDDEIAKLIVAIIKVNVNLLLNVLLFRRQKDL